MTSSKNIKKTQWRNRVQKNNNVASTRYHMHDKSISSETQLILSKLDELNMKMNALLVGEEMPTPEEKRAAEIGKREYKEGKTIPWDEVKKKLRR
ncbi:MAG: hypothetical protein IPJ89_05065 [Candidatus Iainarchaeum archaeon]|uniref:Addiction module protein n=1 Tax=Candidatus Iainarchaeum sp. TaxID=3101447 RepID=A0A7T9DJI4_9ARCH|nr:MAG: hypothetical protein IPJ89_05065 [Candidatus Diapherotrites archaeon]